MQIPLRQVRCCPTDHKVKNEWEEELKTETDFLKTDKFREANAILRVLSHPSRLQIVMLLLNRDHCVCELVNILKERQNLISYNGCIKKV